MLWPNGARAKQWKQWIWLHHLHCLCLGTQRAQRAWKRTTLRWERARAGLLDRSLPVALGPAVRSQGSLLGSGGGVPCGGGPRKTKSPAQPSSYTCEVANPELVGIGEADEMPSGSQTSSGCPDSWPWLCASVAAAALGRTGAGQSRWDPRLEPKRRPRTFISSPRGSFPRFRSPR